jgi:hypothetical protein
MPLKQSKNKHLSWLVLFSSTGTLVCCALPILLVSLGMGATVASLVSQFPILITLSENKAGVFIFSGLLLLISIWTLYRPGRSCPSAPDLSRLCQKSQQWNQRILWLSIIIWSIGFYAAFLALPLQIWIDQSS